jgi:hypothetical protein
MALRLGPRNDIDGSRRLLFDTISGESSAICLGRRVDCVGCAHLNTTIKILRVNGKVDSALASVAEMSSVLDATIRMSDPLIVGGHCTRCSYSIDTDGPPTLRRASDYDDGLTSCPICKDRFVAIEIRDQFTMSDLLSNFAGQTIPAKYALVDVDSTTIAFELEKPDE